MEENRFIVSCQNGDYTAFGQLYDMYIRKIYDFLYFRTLHKQTAEDLTSTVFTKALEKIKQFDAKKAKFSTWLYQIAKNTLIDHFRTLRQTNDIQGIWDMPSDIDIERDADTVLLLEKVRTHIKELPALQRDIVIMRLWDGLPYREIAEVLNISEGNSKVSFARAINKLKVKMGAGALIFIITLKFFILNF